METGWVVSIVLGVVLALVVVAVVIWVVMRRSGRQDVLLEPPIQHETISEHEAHSLSQRTNDRWDALLRSWEEENQYKTA